jgi:sigma-B regulation protein RsbU (phosphoserine phosphatase)
MDSFVTLTYAVFDGNRRRVSMTNAGHNPCLIYRQASRSCESFPSDNMPLAIMPDIVFSQVEFALDPGDCVVFYTDGVTEAMDRRREMYELSGSKV